MGKKRKRVKDEFEDRSRERKFQRSRHEKTHSSPNDLNTKIRDLERLLDNKHDLPADVRVAKERELATTRGELAIALAEKQRRDMIKRYHMVRFFDRKKAERQVNRVRKLQRTSEDLSCTDPDKHAALEREMHIAEVDLNYTIYYPLERPYCSLYPKKKDDEGKEQCDMTTWADGQRGDRVIWELVENAMRQGTLEALRMTLTPKELPILRKRQSHKYRKTRSGQRRGIGGREDESSMHPEVDDIKMEDESDGGFFEEDGGVSLATNEPNES